jgi:hypothetical protein
MRYYKQFANIDRGLNMKENAFNNIEETMNEMILESTTNNLENPFISTKKTDQADTAETKNKKETVEQMAMRIATEGRNLFFDKRGTTYIEVQDQKQFAPINNYLIKIDSEEFKDWLAYECYENYSKTLNNTVIEGVRRVVKIKAKLNGQLVTVYNRVGVIDNVVYIDMGTIDRKIIRVDSEKWEIMNLSKKIFFDRNKEMLELPEPTSGGDLKELLQYLPKMNEGEQCLVLSWLVASFIEHIERAFLLIEGAAGSGKTTTAIILKSLIDPKENATVSSNDNENEVAQIINHQYLPLFDNITSFSRKISDLSCRAFSRGSHTKKQLYTDDQDFSLTLSGNMIITSIRFLKPKGDFLDRCYKIIIDKHDQSSRSREQYEKLFAEVKPRIFGALLTVLSATLKEASQIEITAKYRTVDFDRYALAAARAMGFDDSLFHSARKHCEKIKIISITSSTPLIEALHNFLMANDGHYTGYMSTLLKELPQYTSEPDDLPKQSNALSRKINEIMPELNGAGIQAVKKSSNDHYGASWEFSLTGNMNDDEELHPEEAKIIDELLTEPEPPSEEQTLQPAEIQPSEPDDQENTTEDHQEELNPFLACSPGETKFDSSKLVL